MRLKDTLQPGERRVEPNIGDLLCAPCCSNGVEHCIDIVSLRPVIQQQTVRAMQE